VRDFALLPYGEKTNLDHVLSWPSRMSSGTSAEGRGHLRRVDAENCTGPAVDCALRPDEGNNGRNHKESKSGGDSCRYPPTRLGSSRTTNYPSTSRRTCGRCTHHRDRLYRSGQARELVDIHGRHLGKMGPSTWAPISMAIATILIRRGRRMPRLGGPEGLPRRPQT